MWINDTATDDHMRTWLKHTPAMKFVSSLNGEILWANTAFCEWSYYTLNELRKLTWSQLSVTDSNMESDTVEMQRLDGYRPTYTVSKKCIPKNREPQWGQFIVLRYPLVGEIDCFFCTWEPLKNGTATAFAAAMGQSMRVEQRLLEMTTELKLITAQTDEDRFILTGMRMIQKHPRIALSFLAVAFSIFGLNNVVELLQRTGLIGSPVTLEVTAERNRASD